MTTKYPECEKLQEARLHGSQEIGEFLEWLSGSGYEICKFEEEEWDDDIEEMYPASYYPNYNSIEKWIAEYFKIDLDKVDAERMQIIKELQDEQNK